MRRSCGLLRTRIIPLCVLYLLCNTLYSIVVCFIHHILELYLQISLLYIIVLYCIGQYRVWVEVLSHEKFDVRLYEVLHWGWRITSLSFASFSRLSLKYLFFVSKIQGLCKGEYLALSQGCSRERWCRETGK